MLIFCSELVSGVFNRNVRPNVDATALEPNDIMAPDSIFKYRCSFKYDTKNSTFIWYVDEGRNNANNKNT